MHTPLRHEVLKHVEEVIQLIRPIVEAIGRRDRSLAQQIRDAMNSIGLNVLEGFGNRGGSSRSRFETALGSVYEVQAGVRFGVAWAYVTEAQVAAATASLDRLGGRVYGLLRRLARSAVELAPAARTVGASRGFTSVLLREPVDPRAERRELAKHLGHLGLGDC